MTIIWAFTYCGALHDPEAGFREGNVECIGLSISRNERATRAADEDNYTTDMYIGLASSYQPRAWSLERVR